MRPSCDVGVSLGCGAPAPGWEVEAATVGDDPAVDAVDDETVAVLDDDAAAADEVVAPVDAVVVSSLPHAVTTRHDAATTPQKVRDLLFMASFPPTRTGTASHPTTNHRFAGDRTATQSVPLETLCGPPRDRPHPVENERPRRTRLRRCRP